MGSLRKRAKEKEIGEEVVVVNIMVPKNVHAKAVEVAKKQRRSLRAFILVTVEAAVSGAQGAAA